MKAGEKAAAFVVLLVLLIAALAAGSVYYGATRWKSQSIREIVIEPGSSLRSIAGELSRAGVIGTPKIFEVAGRLQGVGRSLKAGTYEFPAGSTMFDVLGMLSRGEVKQYPFTVIEGWSIADIANALRAQPFVTDPAMPDEFARIARDPAYAAALGLGGAPSLEGYLYPDTYFFTTPLTADYFVKRLFSRFKEVWKELASEPGPKNGMPMREAVTLASIVEKETGSAEERPVVASVFLNRLRIGMPLQSDPTIIYGLPDYDGNIRKGDITNPHPYNTYVHPGLPPGPIANPGRESLIAVLHPADTDYLYFVSRNDGTHQFSATLAEHMLSVREFQLNGSRPEAKR